MPRKLEIFILLIIILGAFFVRLYKINAPLADWHSWRQADTAAVTRNFIQEGFTPFFPKNNTLNPLNGINKPNPNRYFLAEFPIYNILVYPLYYFQGIHEAYSRLVSIFASLITILLLYFLVKEYSSKKVAVLSAFFFAALPFNIYFDRTVMPDPLHIMFSVGSLLFVTLWTRKNSISHFILSIIFYSFTLLTKPYALVLLLPISFIFYLKWKQNIIKQIKILLFIVISIGSLALWQWHINNHPEGMFYTQWLFNQGNIRFTGAYFRWLIFERMNKEIFTTGGIVLFFLGLISNKKTSKETFYYLWLAAEVAFFVIIAKGNVTHDYYQLPIVPIGCIFMAIGLEQLLTSAKSNLQKVINISLGLSCVLLTSAFGWYEVRAFFDINHPEIVEAGKRVDQLLPKNAKVIAPYSDDPAFLYQTNRIGWTTGEDNIEKFIKEGATHLVSVNFDKYTLNWMDKCRVVEKADKWVIIDLTRCKNQS